MPRINGETHTSSDVGGESGDISFERWRADFFSDARSRGLLHNAELMGDVALRLFWRRGTAPTVEALLANGKDR